ncbi:PspA/IM30 family protein [Oceanobacillus halotolerans]|uniref:PspA/IM30 family protein n=1 Tax=Oceanobacillus halotolerans TaxID=2663380 RepID=UPI0013DB03D8|nr:PspA/IM30 family protein [Oceanobacillus halotolerans]
MFKMFRRVRTIVGSELNAMLDKAEDPVKMLNQFLRDMEEDIQEAEGAIAKQVANEKMLKRKLEDTEAMAEKRQQQAEKAVKAGEDDLARRALEEKQDYEKQTSMLQESYDIARRDSEELKRKLAEMKKEYDQMRLKRDSLKVRAESAKTKTKMNRTMSSIGSDESKRGFERMEQKVMEYEAEAETTEDLTTSNPTLDEELDSLEESKVDEELADLKKKLSNE